ncbi:DUF5694 domain-containing protein [Pontibacter cellulosilyticus]|uniref:TraB/GumN family protein n=1 Tax=Pontibacter cellulosilyticus TaxID=1720253 RepID=A0A923SM87_9BACT|nr:DUF5694 domain-containing protein [Pontibacter cellulosilyticus]MBC5991945.1 hypothetical protein [Pontibacter cellulosilyticus]
MKKLFFAALFLATTYISPALAQQGKTSKQDDRAQVMILGTFHFAYPNLDVVKTEKSDQLDIKSPESQRDIARLVNQMAKFNPTKIAVEAMPEKQAKLDSLYQAYLEGRYELGLNETYQLGFRLAKQLGHKRVYATDSWGDLNAYQKPGSKEFEVRDDIKERMEKFWEYKQSTVQARAEAEKKLSGPKPRSLYKAIQQLNQPEAIRKSHENYFREAFQYEEQPYDYTGVDWYNASWFSRNLRIFRNIQRITESPDDRILLIYGSDHVALLQQAVESSPTHQLVPAHKMLK